MKMKIMATYLLTTLLVACIIGLLIEMDYRVMIKNYFYVAIGYISCFFNNKNLK